MSDHTSDELGPLDPVVARNQYAALLRNPSTNPDPELVAFAQSKLLTAKLDKAIREAVAACPAKLHPAQVEYLVGRIESARETK